MRILIVDTCYPAFLAEHYGARPELAQLPYDEQWRALMDRFFGTADSYSHHLEALGHTAHEFVVNCEPLQARWAAEHGVRPRRPAFPGDRRGRDDVLLAQAEAFRPDVCYVQNLEVLAPATLRRLAQDSLLVGQASTEPPGRRRLRLYDLLVSPLPYLVDDFRAMGLQSEYLALAFDPRVLERLPADGEQELGAVFVGSLKRFRRWRSNRVVERAAHLAHIDFWGYGAAQWPSDSPLRANYHGPAWGLEMLGILGRSRIGINRHGDITRNYACNMRLYEATGVGTMLLTDAKDNLGDIFEPGREVVSYADADELAEAVRHYLEAEDERREIARAGQARTLAEHSYAHRMSQLSDILAAANGSGQHA